VLTSLGLCLFARGVYTAPLVEKALAVAGFARTLEQLQELGADTLRRKNAFKSREGFEFRKLRIPSRIMETPSPAGPFDEAFLRKAIAEFEDKL
jgi:aldehyde:ferredoxin oxidoreductase